MFSLGRDSTKERTMTTLIKKTNLKEIKAVLSALNPADRTEVGIMLGEVALTMESELWNICETIYTTEGSEEPYTNSDYSACGDEMYSRVIALRILTEKHALSGNIFAAVVAVLAAARCAGSGGSNEFSKGSQEEMARRLVDDIQDIVRWNQ